MTWVDAVTGQKIEGRKALAVGEVLRLFPAALLISPENSRKSS
jgi:maltooligosyltrehalose synthase